MMSAAESSTVKDPSGSLSYVLKEEEKHGPLGFQEMKVDDFWIAALIDSMKAFGSRGMLLDAEWVDLAGVKGRSSFDVATIRCPIYIVHGDKDPEAKAPGTINYYKMMYPHATFDVMEGFGHNATVGPNQVSVDRITKAMAAMGPLNGSPAPAQLEM